MWVGWAQLTRNQSGRRRGVDRRDRFAQRGAVGQPAVGLDGEADRDRQAGVAGRPDDPDRLPAPVSVRR